MGKPDSDAPGREAWRLLGELIFSDTGQDRFHDAAAAAGLTPPMFKALVSLQPDTAVPMSTLARAWRCDNSWVTGIVDGLEERGYVQRQTHETDRRVKVVQITDAGMAAKAIALEVLFEPPAAVLALSRKDQQVFLDVVRRMRALAGADPALASGTEGRR